jgi:hypothetical protein
MSAEVDTWFAELDHPLEAVMQRVRGIILGADPRMSAVEECADELRAIALAWCAYKDVKPA